MGVQEPGKITRQLCIGMLAHVDAGKTTLSEAVLYLTGQIRKLGRVDKRDSFLDMNEVERERGITVFSKQALFSIGDLTVTLLDTPGHVDFSAEMERVLSVLDLAVLIISQADGVQAHTLTLWKLLARYKVPVMLFINKMDQAGADKEAVFKTLKKELGDGLADFSDTDGEAFFETLAVSDEAALEEYLEGGILTSATIRRLIKGRAVFPCFFGSALKLTGVREFLDGLIRFAPASSCTQTAAQGPFKGRVFKITRDGDGVRLSHLKVLAGTFKVKDTLPGVNEKINQIRLYSGGKFTAVGQAGPGTVCALAGPLKTYAGQSIGEETEDFKPMLTPVLTYTIILPEDTDSHKILRNLRCLEEEDPQLSINVDEESGEISACVMGPVQMEVLKGEILKRFGVEVGFGQGSIVYRETLAAPVEGVGHFEPLRHYAEVHLLMEPLPGGSGLTFESSCSEDVFDRNWQRLVLSLLREKDHRGTVTGAPLTDVKFTLVAGRAHLKHTEGGDFFQASQRAVRQGLMEAGCRLLEPWYAFTMELASEAAGRALSDLEGMGARVISLSHDGGTAHIKGKAPVAGMRDYQACLLSYSKGKGKLSLEFSGYEPCHNEALVIAQSKYDPLSDPLNPSGSVFCSHGAGYSVSWNEVKRHMHVDTPVWVKKRLGLLKEEEKPAVNSGAGPRLQASSWAEDKELEEIFIRTFGVPKKRDAAVGARIISAQEGRGPSFFDEGYEEYLLVDGYNIIFAWEELRELSKATIDGARERLMDILCNYQAFKHCAVMVVFDAYKVQGNTGTALKYHNIHVVYTKEAETADQYIEKLAHEMGRKRRITVATSDGLEQLIIRGQGCLLMSAKELKEEIENMRLVIGAEIEKRHSLGKSYLFRDTDEETLKSLTKMRQGVERQD